MGRTRHLKIGFKEASALCEVLNSRKWQKNVQTSALPSKVVKRTQGYRKTPFPILDLRLQMTLGISFICQLHLFLQRPEVILSWYMWDPCSYISETHFGARNCTNVFHSSEKQSLSLENSGMVLKFGIQQELLHSIQIKKILIERETGILSHYYGVILFYISL